GRRGGGGNPGGAGAAAASGTQVQVFACGCSRQLGRSSRTTAVPVILAACTRFLVIFAAKGWVASTTAEACSRRRYSARPPTPPNPPTRTRPGGRLGVLTRPASEDSTSTPSATRAAASCRASAVPPRIRIVTVASRERRRQQPVHLSTPPPRGGWPDRCRRRRPVGRCPGCLDPLPCRGTRSVRQAVCRARRRTQLRRRQRSGWDAGRRR